MLSFIRIFLVITLTILVNFVDGNVHVSNLTSGEVNGTCCVYGNCSCSSLDHALANLTSNVLINITTDVTLSSLVRVSDIENVTIIGHNSPTVNCKDHFGGIHLNLCCNCIFQGIVWDGCGNKSVNSHTEPGLKLSNSSNITINNCIFQHSQGPAVLLSEVSGDVNINNCNFVHNNHYSGHGAAIHYSSRNRASSRNKLSVFIISDCNFAYNYAKSLVHFENTASAEHHKNIITFHSSKFCHNHGASVYSINQNIYLIENNIFQNNTGENGAGIYISDYSTVIFGENSNTTFINSFVNVSGGMVFLKNHSNIIFDQNSVATFNANEATYGGAIYSEVSCNVTFKATSKMMFSNNFAKQYGGAIYSYDNSCLSFEGNSTALFSNNSADWGGGAMFVYNSFIFFDGKSTTVFNNNTAYRGGAICSDYQSYMVFEGNSTAEFNYNAATYLGGAVFSETGKISFEGFSVTTFDYNIAVRGGAASIFYSHISFERISTTTFSNNTATYGGGAIDLEYYSNMSFEGFSVTKFEYNIAKYGGAVISTTYSCTSFKGNSTAVFNNNTATKSGGAIHFKHHGNISFEGNSTTVFSNNTATYNGGAVHFKDYSNMSFEGNSSLVFSKNNAAKYGGAIYSDFSNMSFEGFSVTKFDYNIAECGGAVASTYSCISVEANSTAVFSNNTANDDGGAIHFEHNNNMFFAGNSSLVFSKNHANQYGGAIYSYSSNTIKSSSTLLFSNNAAKLGGAVYSVHESYIVFEENSKMMFSKNIARDGGAVYSDFNSIIALEGNSATKFINNVAINGGGIYSSDSSIYFKANSTAEFINHNITTGNGGAIYCESHSNIYFEGFSITVFMSNIAVYGGAVLATDHSDIIFGGNSTVTFTKNDALFGATVFSNIDSKVITIGNSTVIFNDHSAKWCNNTCLPYAGQGDVITIDSNGTVWCSNQKSFICLSEKCYCNNLEDILNGLKSHTLVNITDNVTLSSVIKLDYISNISIIGYNSITVICVNGGRIDLYGMRSNLTIEGITWIKCGNNSTPVISIEYTTLYKKSTAHSSRIIIRNCTFQQSLGQAILLSDVYAHVNINHCNFINNHHGGLTIQDSDIITINNCNFSYNENSESIQVDNIAHSFKRILYLKDSNFYNNRGGSVYASRCVLHVSGDVLFENNVAENGAGIYNSYNSTVIFDENSNAKFINNYVDHNGAAIYLTRHSDVIIDQNSIVTFTDNKATNGIVYCEASSNVTFKGTSEVTFSSNSATWYGAAICSTDNSHVTFTGNSKTTFSNNVVSSNDIGLPHGGIMFSESISDISFEETSFTVFNNNTADFGAAILSLHNSRIIFKGQSNVLFNNNKVQSCGVLTSALFSSIHFTDNSTVTYNYNIALYTVINNSKFSASAMCTFQRTNVIFSGYSITTFINNNAGNGAVVFSESDVIIKDHSAIVFKNNVAQYSSGGAFTCYNNSSVTSEGFSNLTFISNKASQDGGAIYSYNMCKATFKDNSTLAFINNTAKNNGGAIHGGQHSLFTFQGYSIVTVNYNKAEDGGVFQFTKSIIIFKEASTVSFYNNMARRSGGVGYFSLSSKMMIEGTTILRFNNNTAGQNGGVLYFKYSNILFKGNSTVILAYNMALYGGAILVNDHCNVTLAGNTRLFYISNEAILSGGAGYFRSNCNFIMEENAMVTFDNNTAFQGGAVWTDDDIIFTLKENSTVFFYNNLASEGGGAVKVLGNSNVLLKDIISIKFVNNSAQYGGAIYLGTTAVLVNDTIKKSMYFINNVAKISGNLIYQDASEICTNNSLNNRIIGINHKFVHTPPNEVKFSNPATCITDGNTHYNSYFIKNMMLGKPIIMPAYVLDCYNQTVDSLQFLVQSEHEANQNYCISGPKHVLISSNRFEGICIIGNQSLSKSTNFSISITLNTALYPKWKQISANLIIELSPCHPGFWQYPNSVECECYNASDIVFCSGSSSTIKRGYWFGSVTGQPSVTFCPINYCNFTCCETSNGYYHLSPVRVNQCRSHRSGTACGICEKGYTLSFDSPECIHMKKCSTGETILLLALILVYWIVIIAAVFSLMHFKVGIGYLYAITYYYSVVDLLLNQNWYHSSALNTTVNVMSSIAKIIPQFLGHFCFTTNMSGIDQQFIHYIHPVVISLFLVLITVLARRSRRLSYFVSKGIIHVICCLLLLSYTSLATTSLLLMRPLIFHDVDKVYTYVSPDIEYFHGRHLAYAVVAVLFTIVIVIGLPLLLTLEPFLNFKINFVKVKPLLDQFQGCYKDKYRCFAAYYMICRLFIITIIIANSSNNFAFHYLLITANVITTLIHHLLKPYSNSLLNDFDGTILHILVLISVLPLVEFFNNFDTSLLAGITYILIILPLLVFITMTIMINKENIKRLPGYCYTNCTQLVLHFKKYDELSLNEMLDEVEYVNYIDDSKRSKVNTTICDV